MLARNELRFFQKAPHLTPRERRAPRRSSWLILGAFSLGYLWWLIVRYISRPAWLAQLPTAVDEILPLAELAGLVTLLLVWGLFFWRRRARRGVTTDQLISRDALYGLSPSAFEAYVAELFRKKGYQVTLRGRSGDRGVDLELVQPEGKAAIVQCKRYRKTVGPEIVRELYGTLIHERVSHAFLVTTADISDSARSWARGKAMTLIDGEALVRIATHLQSPSIPS